MTSAGLPRDVMLCMMEHLGASDLLNVCLTQSNIYVQLFSNEVVWHRYVVHNAEDSSWLGIGFGEVSWKELVRMIRTRIPLDLRKAHTGHELSKELRKIHVRKRFEAPPSSRDYLRIFLEVSTDNPKIPKVIIPGTEVPYMDLDNLRIDKSEMAFSFAPKDGSTFLLWTGEGGNYSVTSVYFVDRRLNPVRVETTDLKSWIDFREKEFRSVLSKADYETVGSVLHNDSQFYDGKPDLRIKCVTRIVKTFPTNVLYLMFVKGVKSSDISSAQFWKITDD